MGRRLHLKMVFTYLMWRLFLFWQRETWRAWWRRPAVFMPAVIATVFIIICWYLATKMIQSETLIMRYSIYVGTNWLTPGKWILILPSLATVIVGINLALAYLVSRSSLALRYLWLWSAVFMAVGWCWLSWLILRINS
ncbi:MAG: hypothetical protein UV47_C0004G0008 [Parcubacteria group bacterium GW2011_GWA2_42_80]|nr:MAG: hypothetical protein UV47_C0004G0008 [Parcubacteria group bacterium GW2011_GWA2_42_80]KKS93233.1 MAG: hypothetical protein UV69_C0010G0005 [Parcubacteria group bacterium GW2011_GWE2_43_12]KKT16017.1 MAG: hypothetical protein UV96_C0006G0005 [Parcubacteria group bacterium GW2011_GWF2_43_38]KKT17059.1 MAG: hypothetical protein UW00_C0017G0003 [Parcubacteria group bacterium GW2011_GWB1_43_66]KKT28092.1 MAG: hypothetical protein UW12_C0008G0009 [Parcubacteria group bacterium GW2011_GWF1_43_